MVKSREKRTCNIETLVKVAKKGLIKHVEQKKKLQKCRKKGSYSSEADKKS